MKRRLALLALVLVGAFLVVTLSGFTGNTKGGGLAPPFTIRTPDGSYVLPYYEQLLGDVAITPGSLVFGNAIDIEFINALGNRSIAVQTFQDGAAIGQSDQWLNTTFSVSGNQIVVLPTLELPSSRLTVPVTMCVDGGCISFFHQTPITILPQGILTYGGLDLISFSITLETLLLMAPLTLLARTLTRRALWTPKISWWLVIPHVATGFLFLIASEFPLLDAAFGGLEFVLFPVVIGILWFFYVMHLFNIATPVEADQISPRTDDRPGVTKWFLLIGILPDGRWVIVGTRWRDWVARLFYHAPVIYDPTHANDDGSKDPPPSSLPITPRKVGQPDMVWSPSKHAWYRFRPEPGRATPYDSFPVTSTRVKGVDASPKRELPMLQLWVDHDQWLSVRLPYISAHREEKVDAEYSPEGKLLKKAKIRQRWTRPHYVDPPVVAGLSSVHFEEPLAAWLRLIDQERAYRLISDLRRQLHKLLTGVYVLADQQTRQTLQEVFELLERERFPMMLEETREGLAIKKKGDKNPDDEDDTDSERAPSSPRPRAFGSGAV